MGIREREFTHVPPQGSRKASLGRLEALLDRHPSRADGRPLLVVVDDNMQYNSMRHEVCAKTSTGPLNAYGSCTVTQMGGCDGGCPYLCV